MLVRFPLFVGNEGPVFGSGDYGVVNWFESFAVQTSSYSNVIEYLDDNSVVDQSDTNSEWYAVKYFYSNSMGAIKKEIIETNEIWNLVEHNSSIAQTPTKNENHPYNLMAFSSVVLFIHKLTKNINTNTGSIVRCPKLSW